MDEMRHPPRICASKATAQPFLAVSERQFVGETQLEVMSHVVGTDRLFQPAISLVGRARIIRDPVAIRIREHFREHVRRRERQTGSVPLLQLDHARMIRRVATVIAVAVSRY